MSKDKIIVTFSIPIQVKEMLDKLAKMTYSTNTKYVVDIIRKDYAYWFQNKDFQTEKGKLREVNNNVN